MADMGDIIFDVTLMGDIIHSLIPFLVSKVEVHKRYQQYVLRTTRIIQTKWDEMLHMLTFTLMRNIHQK